ncbi:MAG TPA: hypothetical protein DGB32_05600 [Dehalococcoidia bacterium]|nr:hypothetical protein [Dehalococcoidia bacterium]
MGRPGRRAASRRPPRCSDRSSRPDSCRRSACRREPAGPRPRSRSSRPCRPQRRCRTREHQAPPRRRSA